MTKSIHIRNFKGIREITLSPEGSLVVIAGANGAGKSSILDAITELIDPRGVRLTPKPIREGESEAVVEFTDTDLGIRAVRTYKKNDAGKLEVWSLDGAKYSNPTSFIADLAGGLIWDPVAFLNLPEKAQRDALLAKVNLPFDVDEIAREKAGAEERRLIAGREVKRLQGALASLPQAPEGTPEEEVSAAAIFDAITAAQGIAHTHEQEEQRLGEMQGESVRLTAQIADLTGKLELLGSAIKAQTAAIAELPPVPDIAPLQAQLAAVDETNRAVRARAQYEDTATELFHAETAHSSAQEAIDAIERRKAAGLASAVFPVDGLSVDETGVTFKGVPFVQSNTATRLRVAFAIATAGDPRLKLVIVRTGDMLDDTSLQAVADLAEDRGYTVLVERDRDSSREIGFTIEDGALAKAGA